VLAAARQHGLEGVVAKRLASPYRPGQRSRDWVKTTLVHQLRVVVGGWTAGQGRRSGRIGALLLGLPDPAAGALRYVGRVGTGFSDPALAALANHLAALARPDCPFTAAASVPTEHLQGMHWVHPVLTGTVAYRERTPDGTLRHPSWRGLSRIGPPPDAATPRAVATPGVVG
jgi:bifunctional non-homologous end joining protein LigD